MSHAYLRSGASAVVFSSSLEGFCCSHRVGANISSSSSTASEFLSTIEVEFLSGMQQDLVTVIRGLATGDGEGQVEGEALRLQVVRMYPPKMLFCPELTRNALLHHAILMWLGAHGVPLGGIEDMRSLTRLAATLFPTGRDQEKALSILAAPSERFSRLCMYGEGRRLVPGFPSGAHRLTAPEVSAQPSAPLVHGGASHDHDSGTGHTGAIPQEARLAEGPHSPGVSVPSGLPPFASFGGLGQRSREAAANFISTGEAPLVRHTNQAHRMALRFKDNYAQFSGHSSEFLDDYVSEYD